MSTCQITFLFLDDWNNIYKTLHLILCYSCDRFEVKHESELTDWPEGQIYYFCNPLFIYFIDDFDFDEWVDNLDHYSQFPLWEQVKVDIRNSGIVDQNGIFIDENGTEFHIDNDFWDFVLPWAEEHPKWGKIFAEYENKFFTDLIVDFLETKVRSEIELAEDEPLDDEDDYYY